MSKGIVAFDEVNAEATADTFVDKQRFAQIIDERFDTDREKPTDEAALEQFFEYALTTDIADVLRDTLDENTRLQDTLEYYRYLLEKHNVVVDDIDRVSEWDYLAYD